MKNINRICTRIILMITIFMMCSSSALAYTMPIKLSSSSADLKVGKTKILYLRGTSSKVTWQSSDSSIVSVTDNGKLVSTTSKATITAKESGTATITASVGDKSYTCKVTVSGLPVSISHTTLKLSVGDSQKLKLNNASGKVKWKSSKKSVAKVSSSGLVTAKKAGKATITAKHGGIKYICTVTVRKSSEQSGSDTSNLYKLQDYLKSKGRLDAYGNLYIKSTSGGNTYKIKYNEAKDRISFYAYIKKKGKSVQMTIRVPNETAVVRVAGKKMNPNGVTKSFKSSTYKKSSAPKFNFATKYEQKEAVQCLKTGFQGWNKLLKNKIGLKMKDIGFTSYK